MTLTVCTLTRNDARNLPRLLTSVAGLATEVLVGDTGSSDETKAVASRLGARVVEIPWDDDFGDARTRLLAQCAGDWIFWLNPDEELLASSKAAVTAAIRNQTIFAYHVLLQEIHDADKPEEFGESIQTRLFRKDGSLRCVGRLHPRFEPTLESIAKNRSQTIQPAAIVARRHAYLSQATEEKVRWVVRLLERELADRPNQLNYQIEYGLNLLHLRDARGHAILGQAADNLNKADVPKTTETQRLLEYLLQVRPEDKQTPMSKEQARELAEAWFPNSPPMIWRLAQSHFQDGNFQAAARLLERLVEQGKTGQFDRSESFSTNLFGEDTYLNLTASYIKLGQLDRAEPILSQLLDRPETRERALQQMGLLARLRNAR